MKLTTPICIVGAGPAGMSAALFLNKLGIDSVLVEKSEFPRDKVCGECYDGHTYHTLRKLNPSFLKEMIEEEVLYECRNYALVQDAQHRLEVEFSKNASPRLSGRRYDFDNFLLKKIKDAPHVTLLQPAQIDSWVRQEDGSHLLTDKKGDVAINSSLVVFATGSRSPMTEELRGLKEKDSLPYIFVRGYFQAKPSFHDKMSVEILFLKEPVPMGMCICPVGNNMINVEIGISKKNLQQKNINARELLLETISKNDFISQYFESLEPVEPIKGIGMKLPKKTPHYSGDGFLMIGDSAGSVNPLTGFGVGHAMVQGMNAAFVMSEALQEKNFSAAFLKKFDTIVYKKLNTELMMSRNLTKFIPYMPKLFPIIFSKPIYYILSRTLNDSHFSKQFLKPSYYVKRLWKQRKLKTELH